VGWDGRSDSIDRSVGLRSLARTPRPPLPLPPGPDLRLGDRGLQRGREDYDVRSQPGLAARAWVWVARGRHAPMAPRSHEHKSPSHNDGTTLRVRSRDVATAYICRCTNLSRADSLVKEYRLYTLLRPYRIIITMFI
jgi:hypothetical protein